jgi:hypothetical protein
MSIRAFRSAGEFSPAGKTLHAPERGSICNERNELATVIIIGNGIALNPHPSKCAKIPNLEGFAMDPAILRYRFLPLAYGLGSE